MQEREKKISSQNLRENVCLSELLCLNYIIHGICLKRKVTRVVEFLVTTKIEEFLKFSGEAIKKMFCINIVCIFHMY